MMYDPQTQLQIVRQRHEDLRAVAGRGRLFGRRNRVTDPAVAAPSPAAAPVVPTPDQQVPALPLRLA